MNRDERHEEEAQAAEMDRLLRRYAADVFDPTDEELGAVSDEQIESLMRRTSFIRRFRTLSPLLTVRRLSVAAMVMICCGIFATLFLQSVDPVAVPAVTRAGEYEVAVRAPRGETPSRTPDIAITGDPDRIYIVSVKDMDGQVVVSGIEVKGGTTVSGSTCFSRPLEKDEVYSIVVKREDKTVNDVAASTFWIVAD